MANIFGIDRASNKITLGTTGTTINIASHTASRLLALDASKDLTVKTIGTDVQAYDAGLTSLAGLTYAAASFVKMTGANTFALRTIGETADDLQGTIDHDLTANYDANKHIDHTGVTLTAGIGLTGGGTIAANRTFAVDGLLEDLDTLGANAADSEFLVGTGAGTLDWESGATARTSIGLGTAATPQFAKLTVQDTTIDTTIGYVGIYNDQRKTAGITDHLDYFYGHQNYIVYNQTGGVIGTSCAFYNQFSLVDGDIGDVSNSRNLDGVRSFIDLNAGKIYGNAFGFRTIVDQEAANEVTGNIYGNYIDIDADGTVGGSVYGLYLNEGSNVDYGIYQNGTAVNQLGGDLNLNRADHNVRVVATTTGAGDYYAGFVAICDDCQIHFGVQDDGYTTVPIYAGQGVIQVYDGDLILASMSAGGELEIYTGGRTAAHLRAKVTDIAAIFNVPHLIKEQAAAVADIAAYGQIWVKSDDPNTLWFTDDAGTDHQIAFV